MHACMHPVKSGVSGDKTCPHQHLTGSDVRLMGHVAGKRSALGLDGTLMHSFDFNVRNGDALWRTQLGPRGEMPAAVWPPVTWKPSLRAFLASLLVTDPRERMCLQLSHADDGGEENWFEALGLPSALLGTLSMEATTLGICLYTRPELKTKHASLHRQVIKARMLQQDNFEDSQHLVLVRNVSTVPHPLAQQQQQASALQALEVLADSFCLLKEDWPGKIVGALRPGLKHPELCLLTNRLFGYWDIRHTSVLYDGVSAQPFVETESGHGQGVSRGGMKLLATSLSQPLPLSSGWRTYGVARDGTTTYSDSGPDQEWGETHSLLVPLGTSGYLVPNANIACISVSLPYGGLEADDGLHARHKADVENLLTSGSGPVAIQQLVGLAGILLRCIVTRPGVYNSDTEFLKGHDGPFADRIHPLFYLYVADYIARNSRLEAGEDFLRLEVRARRVRALTLLTQSTPDGDVAEGLRDRGRFAHARPRALRFSLSSAAHETEPLRRHGRLHARRVQSRGKPGRRDEARSPRLSRSISRRYERVTNARLC